MLNLEKTPYMIDSTSMDLVVARLRSIEDRVSLLRKSGVLTEKTIRHYYGEKRFEQVAESNALEGSTLSVGETELAIVKGFTITGHDPAYIRDAVALDKALTRIAELAKDRREPTNIAQLNEIHGLLLAGRLGAGGFRSERVTIMGSAHRPPKTLQEIVDQMDHWQSWSGSNESLPSPIRSAILHAWLTHIHPFLDGNGRTARAIGNLELIRAGYPPIIFKKKERDRYIDALSESDAGGDLRAFLELVFDRLEGAIRGLELSAQKQEVYSPALARIQQKQKQHVTIWETSVKLLAATIQLKLSQSLEAVGGKCLVKIFDSIIDLDDYLELCAGRNVSSSWAFIVNLTIPGIEKFSKLAFVGHRNNMIYQYLEYQGGPSLFWSRPNPLGFPKWELDGAGSPYAVEMTSRPGVGDEWIVRLPDGSIHQVPTTELANRIADDILRQATEFAS